MFMLTNNDLIIADAIVNNDQLTLSMPAEVLSHRAPQGDLGFMLLPWQPVELLNTTLIVLSRDKNVFCDLLPSPALVEYYRSWKNNEEDKRTRFAKKLTEQLEQITKMSNIRHQEIMTGMSYQDFTEIVNQKFEKDSDWGDPTTNN